VAVDDTEPDVEQPDAEGSTRNTRRTRDHTFQEVVETGNLPPDHLSVEDLSDVQLTVSVDLGGCSMLVRDILELKRGSVIQLEKLAGEMSDVFVNGLPLAKGEVVVIGDTLHVRIGEIIGAEEKRDEGLFEEDGEEDAD